MAVVYEQLVPVLFGTDALQAMSTKAKELNKKRAFICCDKGVRQAGGADAVEAVLKNAGLETYVFDECMPDPTDTFIEGVFEKAAMWKADLVIGLGGGSPMDTAKSVGVLLDNGKPLNKYMAENDSPGFEVRTPVYVIPTSAGTGSECTPMCVIHEMASDRKKTVLRPATLAVLDPTLTVTCPPSVTVNSGMDALSHAVEAYTSVAPNPKDKILAINAIRLIAENLPRCIDNPADLEARTNMLFASNIAGIAFAAMSVHVGHLFAHEIGLRYHLNHGYCCGISVPETIEFVADYKGTEIREIGEAIGCDVSTEVSDRKAAAQVAEDVRALMRRCGLKTMKECGIDREEMLTFAAAAVHNGWFHVMCPGDVSYEQMKKFFAACYDHYQ